MSAPLRIANCSGFFGDRLSAAREMLDGGPIDVLTGDWLAELTMSVLLKQLRRDPATDYARAFLTQLEDVLVDCVDRGIKIVSNAGGLNPDACAREVEAIASRAGRTVRVAVVSGDDVTDQVAEARAHGWLAPHLDNGEPLGAVEIEVASAYLGCWGITEALAAGAQVVVTGSRERCLPDRRTGRVALRLGPLALGRTGRGCHRWAHHRVRGASHRRQFLFLH